MQKLKILKYFLIDIFPQQLFSFRVAINLPWGHQDTTTNLVPIGLAILTITKDTNRSTDKPADKYQLLEIQGASRPSF